MENDQYDIFSVPIWGYVLNQQKHQNYNYIEKILEIQQNEQSEKKSNFGGFQTRDNLHHEPVMKEFVTILNSIANSIISKHVQLEVEVKEMWGNVNNKNNYNGAHIHAGVLSGVFYSKVPPNSGRLILCNPAVRADGKMFRPNNFAIMPEPLACIFFPSWLEHYVEPNLSDDERISISFNIDFKDRI